MDMGARDKNDEVESKDAPASSSWQFRNVWDLGTGVIGIAIV